MIRFIKSHKYCLWLLYFAFYFPAFFLLERFNEVKYIINFAPDRLIPFCEWFVFPYFLWYITMPGSLLLLMVQDRDAFLKLCFMMFGSMTISLLIYIIAPNGIDLRVPVTGDNIASYICRFLYSVDTTTNVCPSIHVSSALATDFAVRHSSLFKDKKSVKYLSFIIAWLISISTLFIKQHSIIDVAAGFALCLILYIAAYHTPVSTIFVQRRSTAA